MTEKYIRKALFVSICASVALLFVVFLILCCLNYTGIVAVIVALLGSLLSFTGSIFLGAVSLEQNKKLIEQNDKLISENKLSTEINEKIWKISSQKDIPIFKIENVKLFPANFSPPETFNDHTLTSIESDGTNQYSVTTLYFDSRIDLNQNLSTKIVYFTLVNDSLSKIKMVEIYRIDVAVSEKIGDIVHQHHVIDDYMVQSSYIGPEDKWNLKLMIFCDSDYELRPVCSFTLTIKIVTITGYVLYQQYQIIHSWGQVMSELLSIQENRIERNSNLECGVKQSISQLKKVKNG